MKNFISLNPLILILSALMALPAWADSDSDESGLQTGSPSVIQVATTDYARLRSAKDVLEQLPMVMIDDDGNLVVMGHGVARIYVDRRLLTTPDELSRISASAVQEVEIITAPDASYDKDVRAVIIVRLIEGKTEGLTVDDRLLVDMKRVPAFSNQVGMKYRSREMEFFTQLSIDEAREHHYQKNFEQTYTSADEQNKLVSRQTVEAEPRIHQQLLTALVGMNYDLTATQNLALAYECDWLRFAHVDIPLTAKLYEANAEQVLDLQHPVSSFRALEQQHSQNGAHDLRATYTGSFGLWRLDAGINSILSKRENYADQYLVNKDHISNEVYVLDNLYLRDYVHAGRTLGKGKLQLGLEHILNRQDISIDNELKEQPHIGGSLKAQQYAAFANLGQQQENWRWSAGLRYEHIRYSFRPENNHDVNHSQPTGAVKAEDLADDYFYPNLTVGVKTGQSDLELSFTRSYQKPDMQNLHKTIEGNYYMESMNVVERISTTTLTWQHKWLQLSASHLYLDDPLFHTIDGKVNFSGNDYNAMEVDLALSPTFGCWKPLLNVHYHRQWLNMELANGRNKLNDPFVNIGFTNCLTLPKEWMVRLNAYWHSKGCVGNEKYQAENFELSSSLLKDLCNHRLTIELSLQNALRDSWLDTTRYADVSYNQSKGYRKRVVRNLSLSLRYRFQR